MYDTDTDSKVIFETIFVRFEFDLPKVDNTYWYCRDYKYKCYSLLLNLICHPTSEFAHVII